MLIGGLGKTDVRLTNSNKEILSDEKNVDFNDLWLG